MSTFRNRLMSFLALNRGLVNYAESTLKGGAISGDPGDTDDKAAEAHALPLQAANDNDSDLDWFEAIHGGDYYFKERPYSRRSR